MKVLVTGASGFLGEALCRFLVAKQISVVALYNTTFPTTLAEIKNITLVRGDITKEDSLKGILQGCSHVFHTAAFCYNWAKDISVFINVNVEGTRNLLQQAFESGVERVVVTSSAGTLGPVEEEGDINENSERKREFFNLYEKTKYLAEKIVLEYVDKGLDTVIVNPTRIFGPGLLGGGNFTTELISRYIRGQWHFLPGNGLSTGNYVYIDDVVAGHWLAMQKGLTGEKYILGGENLSFISFFNIISDVIGKKWRLVKIPMFAMRMFTTFTELYSFVFHKPPGIMKSDVKRYSCNWAFDISKAKRELGYKPESVKKAIEKTVLWLQYGKTKKPVTFITGASSGIGKEIAEECARRGFDLFLVSKSNIQGLNNLVQSLKNRYNVEVYPMIIDILEPDAPERIMRSIKEKGISANMIINNAGLGNEGRFDAFNLREYDEMNYLNIMALTSLTYYLLPDLLTQKKAYLMNVASMAAFQPVPYKAVYAASKAYVLSFTLALRKEFENRINISVLCPGAVPTNDKVRERITRQRNIGKQSVTSASFVARKAVSGLLQNKAVIVPGIVNKILRIISKITPLTLKQNRLARAFRSEQIQDI